MYFGTTTASNTLDIDDISVIQLGSTLNPNSSGMYSSIWHDYDHAVTGTVSGATAVIPTGSNLGGVYFNGTDSKLSGSGMDSLKADITQVFDFYFQGLSTGTATLFDNGNLRVAVDYNSGNERIVVYSDNTTGATSASGSVNPNTWHHLVYTRTSTGDTNIYIDGALSGTGSSGIPAGSDTWYFGSDGGSASYFRGTVGRVTTYNRILTEDEIQRVYDFR